MPTAVALDCLLQSLVDRANRPCTSNRILKDTSVFGIEFDSAPVPVPVPAPAPVPVPPPASTPITPITPPTLPAPGPTAPALTAPPVPTDTQAVLAEANAIREIYHILSKAAAAEAAVWQKPGIRACLGYIEHAEARILEQLQEGKTGSRVIVEVWLAAIDDHRKSIRRQLAWSGFPNLL